MKVPVFRCWGHYFFVERAGDGYTISVPSIPGDPPSVHKKTMDEGFYAARCSVNSGSQPVPEYAWEYDPTQQDLVQRYLMVRNGLCLLLNDFETPLYQHLSDEAASDSFLWDVLRPEYQLLDDMRQVLAYAKMPNSPFLLAKIRNEEPNEERLADYAKDFCLDSETPELPELSMKELFSLFCCLDRSIAYVEHDGLVCLKYSKWVFQTGWSNLAKLCRGRVYEKSTGRLVSLPFDKFFNLNETAGYMESDVMAKWGDKDTEHELSTKMDGSLIIVSRYRNELLVTTGKSFDNEHIRRARELIRFKADDLQDGHTYLFELIHPETRIVVDYGEEKALYLLAIRNNATGAYLRGIEEQAGCLYAKRPDPRLWGSQGPQAALSEMASELERHGVNQEGYVLSIFKPDGTGYFVKLKYREYFLLSQQKEGHLQKRVFHNMFFGDFAAYLDQVGESGQEVVLRQREYIESTLGSFVIQLNKKAQELLAEAACHYGMEFRDMMRYQESRNLILSMIQTAPQVMRPYLLTAMRRNGTMTTAMFNIGFTWDKWAAIRDFMEEHYANK